MFRVERHLDAPIEGSPRYSQIFQALFHKLNHFITAGFRLNEVRVFIDEFEPLIGVLIHFKEVRFFLNLFYRAATIWAGVVRSQVEFSPERFTWGAIPTFVFSLINITFIIGLLEELLHHLFMAFIRSTDEIVIGNIQMLPQVFKTIDDTSHIFVRSNALFFSSPLDFLPMFIRTGQEANIIACQTFKPSDGIRHRCAIGMANMQFSTWVVNRCCNIECLFFCHNVLL